MEQARGEASQESADVPDWRRRLEQLLPTETGFLRWVLTLFRLRSLTRVIPSAARDLGF